MLDVTCIDKWYVKFTAKLKATVGANIERSKLFWMPYILQIIITEKRKVYTKRYKSFNLNSYINLKGMCNKEIKKNACTK